MRGLGDIRTLFVSWMEANPELLQWREEGLKPPHLEEEAERGSGGSWLVEQKGKNKKSWGHERENCVASYVVCLDKRWSLPHYSFTELILTFPSRPIIMHFTFFFFLVQCLFHILFFPSSSRRRPQLPTDHPSLHLTLSHKPPFDLMCTFLIAPHYPFILKLFYAMEEEGGRKIRSDY